MHDLARLILLLVPLDVILVRDALDLPPQRIRLLDQGLPSRDVEAPLRVQLVLAVGHGDVQGGAVGDLAVVPQEVEVAEDDCREAREILFGIVRRLVSRKWSGEQRSQELTVIGSIVSQPYSVLNVK